MGFFDKVKKIFIEEEELEDDEVKVKPTQVTIAGPEKKEENTHDYEPNQKYDDELERRFVTETKLERKPEVKEEPKEEVKQVERSFKEFTLDDFVPDKSEIVTPVKQEYTYTRTETVIKPSGYGIRKEEKKVFTPTPIISPIYGVLDKNYKKEEIKDKKKRPTTIYSQFDKIDVDDIRKKAYGTLEDELEENLTNTRDAIIFSDDIDTRFDDDKEITDYEEQPLDIFKELEKRDALDDLLNNYDLKEEQDINVVDDINKGSLVEDELNRDYDDYEDDGLDDDDLFNLIDSMYNKED